MTRYYQEYNYSHLNSKNIENAKTMILKSIIKIYYSYNKYIDIG